MRQKLGTCLVQAGLLSSDDLASALDEAARSGEQLGAVLVRLKFASEHQIARALAAQLGLSFVDLTERPPNADAIGLVPRELAEAHALVAVGTSEHDGAVIVAMSDPLLHEALDEVKRLTGRRVQPVIAARGDILTAIRSHYPLTAATDVTVTASRRERTDNSEAEALDVTRLLQHLVDNDGSEVHFEPEADALNVRMRINGELRLVGRYREQERSALLRQLKLMAGMTPEERRLPQEGRIRFEPRRTPTAHFRVATLNGVHGERVVIHRLDPHPNVRTLDELGLTRLALKTIESFLDHRAGLILFAGPRRSGVTTTLNACGARLLERSASVISIGDPVEIELTGAVHTAVDRSAALTPAVAVQAAGRQRVDAILVGGLDDTSAVAAALDAASDCLVLAGVRADTAVTALAEAAAAPYRDQYARVLIGVVAQRVVFRLCERCRRAGPEHLNRHSVFDAVGCDECDYTGYRGRTGIFEVLRPTETLRRLIRSGADAAALDEAAVAGGLVRLNEAAVDAVRQGKTTFREVARQIADLDEPRTLCQECGAAVGVEFNACPQCGTATSRPCAYCGRFLQAAWDYCPFCARAAGPNR